MPAALPGSTGKILKRVRALAEYRLDALHISYCMTALCPFLKKYETVITETYPDLEIVMGTHIPKNKEQFRKDVKELSARQYLRFRT